MSNTATIEWSEDSYDCETCGTSYATGAKITLNGKVIMDKPAVAHCYDGVDVSTEEAYLAIITALDCVVHEALCES